MLFSIVLISAESESCSVMSDSLQPHELYSPWNSPGQNTGVGSHALYQGGLPDSGIKPMSPASAAGFFTTDAPGKPHVLTAVW